MVTDIIAAAQLSDEDTEALAALHAAVYPPKPRPETAAPAQEWALPQWHFLIRDGNGQLISHVGAVTRTCLCDREEIPIGGIGGVMTRPSQRGKGYASAAIRSVIEFLRRDRQVDMILLFCAPRLRGFYRRLGFGSFAADTYVRQYDTKTMFPRNEIMVMPAKKPVPHCAALDLRGLPW
jgi:predicted acetyltransferase